MESAERFQLAQDLCARLVAAYPGEVILGGLYGSTARGADTAWSDLEMLFVVQDGSKAAGKHLIYRDIAVGYQVFEQSKLEHLLGNPTAAWPFWMGVLSILKVLHGNPEQVNTWLRLGQSVSPEKFRHTLRHMLPELVLESYGRILSCRERNNTADIGCAVIEVLLEMNVALCLLNQRWVTHDYYQGIIDACSFSKLHQDFKRLAPALWTASDVEEIVRLAQTLVNNFWQLLADEGLQINNYQDVADLPL